MDNVSEVVALLRKQAELEIRMMTADSRAVDDEQELEATRRRLIAHPHALRAVLQTARALGRTPDTVTVREVGEFRGDEVHSLG